MEMERTSVSFPLPRRVLVLFSSLLVFISPSLILVHVFIRSDSWSHFYIITTNILPSLDLEQRTIAHLILGQVEHALVDAVLTRIRLLRSSGGRMSTLGCGRLVVAGRKRT